MVFLGNIVIWEWFELSVICPKSGEYCTQDTIIITTVTKDSDDGNDMKF